MSKSGSWINNHLFTYTPYCYAFRISISLDILSEIFIFKLVTFSRSYARKQKWVFFS